MQDSVALVGTPYSIDIEGGRAITANNEVWILYYYQTGEVPTPEVLNQLLDRVAVAHVRTLRSGELPGLLLFHCDQQITQIALSCIGEVEGVNHTNFVITKQSAVNPAIIPPLYNMYKAGGTSSL